jgi:alpha-ketoglutarate-dependent taurine dioxygenase
MRFSRPPRSYAPAANSAATAARNCCVRRRDSPRVCAFAPWRHRAAWSVGDTGIWDNRGVLHRAAPYDPNSAREMLRPTVLGDEPVE